MRRPVRFGLTLFTVLAAGGVAAAPAQAAPTGTASVFGGTKVRYQAAKGKQNRVVLTRSGNTVTIDDRVAVRAGKGCKAVKGDKTRVRCATGKAPTRVYVYTSDRTDTVTNRSGLRMTADGGSGSDRITGGPLGDVLRGGDGADKIWGLGGRDRIDTGAGNDVVSAGDGDDVVMDGSGRTSGNDTIHGGPGFDEVFAAAGNDRVYGGADTDFLHAGPGRDLIDGGPGDDTVRPDDCNEGSAVGGCVAADVVRGGPGVDTVLYLDSDKPVTADLDGASGDDGRAGERDTLGADLENLTGGSGNDRLTGNAAANIITGLEGTDVLRGGAGADLLDGGPGRDNLHGDAGDDTCGSSAADTRVSCER